MLLSGFVRTATNGVRGMKLSNAKDFGMAVKLRRKQLGYTQAYISDVTGFSTSFISDLENGKKTAELDKALFIANLLGLDVIMKERS